MACYDVAPPHAAVGVREGGEHGRDDGGEAGLGGGGQAHGDGGQADQPALAVVRVRAARQPGPCLTVLFS